MGAGAFAARGAGGRLGQAGFDIVLDLRCPVSVAECKAAGWEGRGTLVAAVPVRKKTAKRAKKTLHGCTAWATAVRRATAMPGGVNDLRDQAR